MICLDIETQGLDPSRDSIVAIGVMDIWGLHVFSSSVEELKISTENAEKRILTEFSSYLGNCMPDDTFLTYNGLSFDFPFLAARARRHGNSFLERQLKEHSHLDIFPYCVSIVGRKISKYEACSKLANLYSPRRTDGLWSSRLYSNIALLTVDAHCDMLAHNALDLSDTYKLYTVLKQFPDFTAWRMLALKNEATVAKAEMKAEVV